MTLKTLLVFVLLSASCDDHVNTVPPETAAAKFLKDTGTPYEGAPTCTGGDTDHDGYVTCLVRRPKVDAPQGEFLSLQCAAVDTSYGGCDPVSHPYTSGCKLTPIFKQ